MNFVNFTIGTSSAPQTWLSTVIPGVTVALIAGIVLFLLNWLRDWLTGYWKKKSEAEVLAFSLATIFDGFISACSNAVDDPLYQDPETQCWQSTVTSPTIIFPEHITWSVFPKALQYKIRSIPNKIDVAERNISSLGEYGDGPPDYGDAFEESSWRYAWLGLEAYLINEILADKYGVPVLERGDWDPADRFKSEIAKIDKSRNEEKSRQWPVPEFMVPKIPIEVLHARHAMLTADLEAAMKKGPKAP
ncbi:hypothetical protein F4V91_06855 [Neorhizobium galegae]|uniref:Uncharacterized protein n=1 Tax=Neorhizobium galegae TaxID=399 RepID=A0A6A1TP62_NEOGA|nr:hypothetical protein [Neorhizobium galegae]KAB1086178.1 hypothetical protein F4V91_06855 [Neorhizobium galegae]